METVLGGLSYEACLVYLDDIIIVGRSFEEHFNNIRRVLQKLKEANLKLSPSKCHLFRREVTYLGHIISAEDVRTDPDKISAVKNWKNPTDVHQLRSFLGLCTYYRKFVKDFSTFARPLHKLTEAKQKFIWTDECNNAFNKLKDALTLAPILAYPEAGKQFILDIDDQERVIAYFSKCLSRPERNYCVTRKELLAIVKAVEHFHPYLYGRRFLLRTDHASLTWLLNFKNPEGQIAWWIQRLQENEEIACENHFKRTYTRDSTGRFAVKFPFQDSSDELGSSRDIAVHRLQQIERWFSKNRFLSDQYHKFMDDYLKLGHMELIPENEIDVPASSSFYLPHHPVPNKNGDKFRVVFDGSAKSSSGVSLNAKLMVGPQLQTDLTTLLLRFRMHKIAITADIEKMYRQITLHDSDFQRIVWRNSPFEPIQDLRLTSIAYGTASAPYLAIKCLQQLALNESNNFPLASKAALKDFYVDDLMSGANSLSEALELQNQWTQMLSSAGLVLRKWASNRNELLNSIDSDMRLSTTSLNIDNDDTVKTLGILWHPASDVFYFKITPLTFEGTLTKRTLLSTIAKTFDPLGWLSPITIQYKTIMQRLWKQQLQWDERVPTGIKLEWEQLANDVQLVKDIKIPRFLLVDSDNQFHLFGFSDASEKAYAAAIYCRSVSDTGKIDVQLIIATTRVAPLKPVSLPRLELCGTLLLVKLMGFTCKALNYPISQAQFYTDSTIVLSWIGSHASRWKTFIANRVAKIQTLSSATQWHHISGSANPADLATRGVSSSTLLTSIWLCGRKFLHETFPFQTDSSVPSLNDAVPEERYCTLQSIIVPNHLPDGNDLLHKFSSLSKLKRVISYCSRFVNNCKNSKDKTSGFLKTNELNNAMCVLIKLVQTIEFNNEINALK
ncbi:retrovirus-related Pol polyprotein from transposon 17.6 [Trichonephila clavata]|uniref:RNA-directed DNA polymerase n=1 Tax=Trichonephila clavata TaxID=2740835 RepID=A0A8X6LCI0_TRICU|nr:retrovirus-related Pol polyprotein from transposon 17.6 [Trichonephila clavata]